MPNVDIQQASQALGPLLRVLNTGPNTPQIPGMNVPLANDSAHAHPSSPTYYKSLESLLQMNAAQNGGIMVRSQNGGYAPIPSNTGRITKSESGSAQAAPDLVVGLGLFNPRTFMKGSRDDNSDRPQDDGMRGYSKLASEQVDALSQLIRAQQIYNASQTQTRSFVAPIREDGVELRGTAPRDVVNSFEELMNDLVHKLAEVLNGAAVTSQVASTKPSELLDSRPESLIANAANSQEMMHVLEDAVSFHLLQQSASVAAEEKSAGMIEAAKIVLSTIVGKLQSGEIESNPETMKQIVEALHNVLESSPELMQTGIGERLNAMRTMLGNVLASQGIEPNLSGGNVQPQAAHNMAAPNSPAMATKAPRSPESIGWAPTVSRGASRSSAPQSLDSPRQFKKITSGSVTESGTARGTGFEDDEADEYAFNLQPQPNGEMSIMTAYGNQNGEALFKVDATMDGDDENRPTGIGEGRLSWNNGQDAIRLGARGAAEVSADGGESWSRLSNEESSHYTSSDGRFNVQYDPVERTVRLEARNNDGSRAGAATMAASGEGVSFADLTARNSGRIG